MKVRCNCCGMVFDEEYINILDGEEYCPYCNTSGYLMDVVASARR